MGVGKRLPNISLSRSVKFCGSGGNDVLNGGAGKDKLFGGTGADTLNGGAKDDILKGQGGSDTLVGGAGKDTLTGGAGADKFVFNAASDSVYGARGDVITDFNVGVDLIDLSAFGVGFISTDSFSGVAEVRVITKGSDTVVRVDVDGDGNVDMTILLEGIAGLTATDFLL